MTHLEEQDAAETAVLQLGAVTEGQASDETGALKGKHVVAVEDADLNSPDGAARKIQQLVSEGVTHLDIDVSRLGEVSPELLERLLSTKQQLQHEGVTINLIGVDSKQESELRGEVGATTKVVTKSHMATVLAGGETEEAAE